MRKLYVSVRERHHRLPREAYRGRVVAVFHTCVAGRRPILGNGDTVARVRDVLLEAAERHGCSVLAYCFMPDHVHVVLRGLQEDADLWAAMVRWKRMTGPWLVAKAGARWQKDFYDSVLVGAEAVDGEIAYVLLNPVREKMVSDWWDYPYSWRAE